MSLTDLLALAEKRRTRGCLLGRWAGAAVSWGQRRSSRDHLTRAHVAGDRGFRPRPPADTRDFVEQNQPAPPGMEGPEPSRHRGSDGQGTESAILGQLYSFASDSGFVVTTTLPVTSRAP